MRAEDRQTRTVSGADIMFSSTPVRIFGVVVTTSGSRSSVAFRNGQTVGSPVGFQVEVPAGDTRTLSFPDGWPFSALFLDIDANTTLVSVLYGM